MSRKIVGIVGSYRKGGVIDQVVSLVLSSAEEHGAEVDKIYLLDTNIEFCTNCRTCTQEKGIEPGHCVLTDDMDEMVRLIGESDAIVLGAPVNSFNINALTRRFLERLIRYCYWPWKQYAPAFRIKQKTKKAVLVTSSAMPASMGLFLTGAMRALKLAVKTIGAKPVATIFIGMASVNKTAVISSRISRKAREAGRRLASE